MKTFIAKGVFLGLSFMLLMSLLAQHGCSEPREKKAVYVLVDTSGTYSKQFDKVQIVMRYLLGSLTPGESLALARIDSESFNEKDIIARMSFDLRPSMANAQKRAFIESIDMFGKNIQASRYTDITGGILQAIEYLNETQATQRTILIFSDLKEEIKKGQVRDFPISFNGIHVVAINVTKLKSDNVDPREYQNRLDAWAKRVEQGGGNWKLINDMNNLSQIIE
ncbi:MAG: VWA domain-containing protein [Gammaproteobacteria bacterium]|nr:VWA domain-containing protein [Gammaproteobacteria bacterium]